VQGKTRLKKIVFQSKVGDPQICVFSYTRMTFLLLWPWPWPNDLDIRTLPRYSEDVPAWRKWSF